MGDPRWLDDAEARAWRGYRRMRGLLDLQISRDLTRDTDLSDPDYDVLSNLSETPGQRLRVTELADRMLWSQSRLSHHLTRMNHRGLVVRERCTDDGRGALVALTHQGLQAIQQAAPDHVASVREHFIDLLTDDQITTLGDIADIVLRHLTDDHDQ